MTTQNDIVYLAPDLLHHAADNANVMNQEQKALLTEAIRLSGFLQPILVKFSPLGGHEIVDGHHRTAAAIELGLNKIPAVVLDANTTREQATAISLAMNRLRGELDMSKAGRMVADLVASGWDAAQLAMTGFAAEDVAELVKAMSQVNTDKFLEDAAVTEFSTDADVEAEPPAFLLELRFETREKLKKVKRALKKAAGPHRDLSVGLLRLLEVE